MGIHCEINLFKTSDGVYKPGSIVSGIIKYAVDEDTIFEKITVSLKGKGHVMIQDLRRTRRDKSPNTYRSDEDYVDMDNVVLNNDKGVPLSIGLYETGFNFKLPYEIPSSLMYHNRNASYRVRCQIFYYVRIKFERAGFMNFDKKFKKELTVISRIKPKLPKEPLIYGEQSKLFQLFKSKNSIVNIKANIGNSVIRPGGKVEIDYELFNDTNLVLSGVETKVIEVYTFKSKAEMTSDVENTESKTGPVKSDEKQIERVSIQVPSDKSTLQFARIASRDYFVCITADLPFPHRNVVLKIPLEIGEEIQMTESEQNEPNDPPPSYWEVMGEEKKEKRDFFDDEEGEKS